MCVESSFSLKGKTMRPTPKKWKIDEEKDTKVEDL